MRSECDPRLGDGCRGFFALGTGRCGSTLLSSLLRAHPEVLSLSELFSSLGGPRILAEPASSGEEFLRRVGVCDSGVRELVLRDDVPEVLAGDADRQSELPPLLLVTLPHLSCAAEALWRALCVEMVRWPCASPAQHLSRLCEHLRGSHGRRVWVERSGGSIEYAPELAHAFPAAGFFHLLRDGRACALSMSAHPFFRVHLARLLTHDPGRPAAECLRDAIPLDRFGAFWSALMHRTERTVRDAAKTRPQLVLRYERLVADPVSELGRLGAFLGLAGVPAWIEAVRPLIQPRMTRLPEIDAAERIRLERACLPGLRILDRLTRDV